MTLVIITIKHTKPDECQNNFVKLYKIVFRVFKHWRYVLGIILMDMFEENHIEGIGLFYISGLQTTSNFEITFYYN